MPIIPIFCCNPPGTHHLYISTSEAPSTHLHLKPLQGKPSDILSRWSYARVSIVHDTRYSKLFSNYSYVLCIE